MFENEEDRLDEDFNQTVRQMKPYLAAQTNHTDRHLTRSWIKKICSQPMKNKADRKNRNLYSLMLVKMLQRGKLEQPFDAAPQNGKIPTIPAFMINYLDDSTNYKNKEPSWLNDTSMLQEEDLLDTSKSIYRELFSPKQREKFMLPTSHLQQTNDEELFSLSIPQQATSKRSVVLEEKTFQSQYEAAIKEKEVMLKAKLMDSKAREERVKVQQQHDQVVHQILERKNQEMTEVKTFYQQKFEEQKKNILVKDEKLLALNKQLSSIKAEHEQEETKTRVATESQLAQASKDYEKTLFEKLGEFESQIFELQKTNRANVSRVVKDAEEKITAMRGQYEKETQNTRSEVQKLKEQLSKEKQNSRVESRKREKCEKEKNFEIQLLNERLEKGAQFTQELEGSAGQVLNDNKKIKVTLQTEREAAKELKRLHEKQIVGLQSEHDRQIKQINEKNTKLIEQMQTDFQENNKKVSLKHSSLQDEHNELKNEHQKLKQGKELSEKDAKELLEREAKSLTNTHAEEMNRFKGECNETADKDRKTIESQENEIREKNEEIARLIKKIESHIKETNEALDTFKRKAEEDSNKIFNDCTAQMEKQKADFDEEKTSLKKNFDGEVSNLHLQIEKLNKDKANLMQTKQQTEETRKVQIEEHLAKIQELEKEVQTLRIEEEEKEILKRKMEDNKKSFEEKINRHLKTIQDLETNANTLQSEVMEANEVRKDQLREVAELRQQEQQAALRSEQAIHMKFKSDIEDLTKRLEIQHTQEFNEFKEKTSLELKNIEEKYEKKKNEEQTKHIEQMEIHTMKYEELEQRHQHHVFEAQEKLSECRQQYEMKMKRMLSTSVQKDLEDTIEALREQLKMLQARCDILQEELNIAKHS